MNQVRALAQLACIIMLLAFALSFVLNNAEEEELNERDRFTAMAKYYATKSSGSFSGEGGGGTAATTNVNARGRKSSRSRSTSPSKRSTKSSPGRSSSTVFV